MPESNVPTILESMSVHDSHNHGPVIPEFATLKSCVNQGFWHSLASLKLDHLRVDESPVSITGYNLLF